MPVTYLPNPPSTNITLEALMVSLNLDPNDYSIKRVVIEELKAYQEDGFGVYKVGRRGHPTRWEARGDYSPPPTTQTPAPIVTKPIKLPEPLVPVERVGSYRQEKPGTYAVVCIPIRADMVVRVALPVDLTADEREKVSHGINAARLPGVVEGGYVVTYQD